MKLTDIAAPLSDTDHDILAQFDKVELEKTQLSLLINELKEKVKSIKHFDPKGIVEELNLCIGFAIQGYIANRENHFKKAKNLYLQSALNFAREHAIRRFFGLNKNPELTFALSSNIKSNNIANNNDGDPFKNAGKDISAKILAYSLLPSSDTSSDSLKTPQEISNRLAHLKSVSKFFRHTIANQKDKLLDAVLINLQLNGEEALYNIISRSPQIHILNAFVRQPNFNASVDPTKLLLVNGKSATYKTDAVTNKTSGRMYWYSLLDPNTSPEVFALLLEHYINTTPNINAPLYWDWCLIQRYKENWQSYMITQQGTFLNYLVQLYKNDRAPTSILKYFIDKALAKGASLTPDQKQSLSDLIQCGNLDQVNRELKKSTSDLSSNNDNFLKMAIDRLVAASDDDVTTASKIVETLYQATRNKSIALSYMMQSIEGIIDEYSTTKIIEFDKIALMLLEEAAKKGLSTNDQKVLLIWSIDNCLNTFSNVLVNMMHGFTHEDIFGQNWLKKYLLQKNLTSTDSIKFIDGLLKNCADSNTILLLNILKMALNPVVSEEVAFVFYKYLDRLDFKLFRPLSCNHAKSFQESIRNCIRVMPSILRDPKYLPESEQLELLEKTLKDNNYSSDIIILMKNSLKNVNFYKLLESRIEEVKDDSKRLFLQRLDETVANNLTLNPSDVIRLWIQECKMNPFPTLAELKGPMSVLGIVGTFKKLKIADSLQMIMSYLDNNPELYPDELKATLGISDKSNVNTTAPEARK